MTKVKETVVRMVDGAGVADIAITNDGTETKHSVPISSLLEVLAKGIAGGEAVQASTLTTQAKVIDPLAWKINLFPEMPYAHFEASKGGLEICVRGFEACTKMLSWRPDTLKSEKPTPLAFRLPRCLWVVAWKNKKMIKAWVFTCDQWPTNVVDGTTSLVPWGAGNVFERGDVCWGSTAAPSFGADGVGMVASTFFGSIFNDHIPHIHLEAKYQRPQTFRYGFSLMGLFEQTVVGKEEKVGTIPHITQFQTNLRQVIASAAGE